MSLTTHLGYGRFRVQDLLLGEEFARFDGSLAKVCEQQPYRHDDQSSCNHPYLPDHILVWVDWATANDRKIVMHKTALAYAITPEQARRIALRTGQRQEQSA